MATAEGLGTLNPRVPTRPGNTGGIQVAAP